MYLEHIFVELSSKRQIEIIYKCVRELEQSWGQPNDKTNLVFQIQLYLSWLSQSNDPLVKPIASLERILRAKNFNETNLTDLCISLERFLNKSVQDHEFIVLDKDLSQPATNHHHPIIFILDHMRSAFNVGAIFRTSECLQVEAIYLVGNTPSPDNSKVQQTTMSTEKLIQWEKFATLESAIAKARTLGFAIYALETTPQAKPLFSFQFTGPSAFVFGNERFGISPAQLSNCDATLSIPVWGQKNSLNVASTLAIVGYEFARQFDSQSRTLDK